MKDRDSAMELGTRDGPEETMNVVRAAMLLMSAVAFGLMVL